jgi:predicted nucleotidyltransferase
MYGLLNRDLHYLFKVFRHFVEIDKVILFGSRAMGNYRKGSDVDIVICGEKISDRVIAELSELLNEVYPLPYFFDIIRKEKYYSTNKKIKKIISFSYKSAGHL